MLDFWIFGFLSFFDAWTLGFLDLFQFLLLWIVAALWLGVKARGFLAYEKAWGHFLYALTISSKITSEKGALLTYFIS